MLLTILVYPRRLGTVQAIPGGVLRQRFASRADPRALPLRMDTGCARSQKHRWPLDRLSRHVVCRADFIRIPSCVSARLGDLPPFFSTDYK
jgi:hypothetical protein